MLAVQKTYRNGRQDKKVKLTGTVFRSYPAKPWEGVALHDLLPKVHLAPQVKEQHPFLLHVGRLLHHKAHAEGLDAVKVLFVEFQVKV